MATLANFLSLFLLALVLAVSWLTAKGVGKLLRLDSVAPLETLPVPRVSILIPVRNEADKVEAALQSVLALDYANFEVIVVDDRSTDATSSILQRMSHEHANFILMRIETLPKEWIGKNYALHVASSKASGDLLLFTDADVVYETTALSRAVRLLRETRADHLTLLPHCHLASFGVSVFALAFTVLFTIFSRPWRVSLPSKRAFVGVGAFNLLRRETYYAIGTHRALALRPDDDMKLAKLVKQHGFRQTAALGTRLVSLDFYPTVSATVEGFTKNAFPGLDYRLSTVSGATGMLALVGFWPFVGILYVSQPARFCYAASIGLVVGLFLRVASVYGLPKRAAFAYPVGIAFFIYTLLRSTILTLRQGGIFWRETFYPLSDLKRNRR